MSVKLDIGGQVNEVKRGLETGNWVRNNEVTGEMEPVGSEQ